MGAKKPYGGFFLLKFLVKKAMISYNVGTLQHEISLFCIHPTHAMRP